MSLQLKKRKGTLPEDAEEDHSFGEKKKKHVPKEAKPLDSFCWVLVIKLEKIWTFENKKLNVR